MTDLSSDQAGLQAQIRKSAVIWGAVAGVIVGLLALWLLGGQGAALRYGGALVTAVGVGILVFRASYGSQAKSARCAACGAAFSRARSDRAESLKSSEPKEEREVQPDKSVEVTTWTEEKYDVTETYVCAKCADVTTNTSQTTRRRDVKSVVEPVAAQKKTDAQTDSGKSAAVGKKSESDGRKGRGRGSRG